MCENFNHRCPMNIRGIFFEEFSFSLRDKKSTLHGIILIFFVNSKFSTYICLRTCVETYDTPILAQFFPKFRGFSRGLGHGLNSPVQIYSTWFFTRGSSLESLTYHEPHGQGKPTKQKLDYRKEFWPWIWILCFQVCFLQYDFLPNINSRLY